MCQVEEWCVQKHRGENKHGAGVFWGHTPLPLAGARGDRSVGSGAQRAQAKMSAVQSERGEDPLGWRPPGWPDSHPLPSLNLSFQARGVVGRLFYCHCESALATHPPLPPGLLPPRCLAGSHPSLGGIEGWMNRPSPHIQDSDGFQISVC